MPPVTVFALYKWIADIVFDVMPNKYNDPNTPNPPSGRVIKIVNGCTKDSNWPASTR